MPKQQFGLLNTLTIEPRDDALVCVSEFQPEEDGGFRQVLTRQACHALWHLLGLVLFAEQGKALTQMIDEIPLILPPAEVVTSHVTLADFGNGCYELLGVLSNGASWEAQITRAEAKRLWAILDILLYPVGWTGRESQRV